MRKGRSQRKARETRGSLPALSKRPASLAVGAGTDRPGLAPTPGGGPKVVIGLTSPRSSEESSVDTRETRGPETGESGADRTTRLEVLPELVREGTDVASVGDVDSLAGVEREPLSESDPFASEPLLQALGLGLDETHDETHDETEETPDVARLTPDEISIPPMGDLSPRTLEPIAERFFSEGELVAAHPPLPGEDEAWDIAQDKAQRKSLPHVVERRQRFARYVRWAVGTAAVVCVAALARTAISPAAVSSISRGSAAAVLDTRGAPELKAAAPLVTAPAPTQPTAPEPASTTLVAPPATSPAEAQVALVEAPKVDVPKAAEAVAPSAPAPGDKTALQEKNDARRALERGKLADAIAAGERSVALDPLDGEAWLLLGASYQEKGKNAEARRCYTSCVTEGKRGPIGECRAMLH